MTTSPSFRILAWMVAALLLTGINLYGQAGATGNYQTVENILYKEQTALTDYELERCRLDIYYPQKKTGFATIVWFHGGGITSGEKFVPKVWLERGFAVVAVNYRLSPKAKCPEYIDDAAAAVAWTFKNIAKYGGSVTKIVVSGHSAGGYLASMVGLDKQYLAKYKVNADHIAALVPFSGHAITHMTVRKERGIPDKQPIIDEYAPLYFVRSDAPPLYLITGGRDTEMLGRYEENAYFYRMMLVAGHTRTYLYEMDGFGHSEMAIPGYSLTLKILKNLGLN